MGIPYAEVIGDPIAHSKSPLIHRFWLEKLGLEGDYRAKRIRKADLRPYLSARRTDPSWRGCNVTMPLKVQIMPLLDGLFEAGKVTGAANLVMNVEGSLVGDNTDVRGFAEPFRTRYPERGSAFLIGAGGAARAAFIALAGLGFEPVEVGNRNMANAEAMLRALGQAQGARSLHDPLPAVDLLVNASAMGMDGCAPPISLATLPKTAIVYDLVYDPVETPLLTAARRQGLRTVDGLTMLIGQADAAFRHFFEGEPPRQHDSELRERLTR